MKVIHVRLITLLLVGLLLCSGTGAAELANLYETAVVAKSQSERDKAAAIKEALALVLKRIVAGGADGLNSRAAQAVLAAAPRYVRQYQYSLTESGSGMDANARIMRVLFDETALLMALKNGNVRIWPADRPETLLWLVIEDNGSRAFFKSELAPEIDGAVRTIARKTGLPLLFPLLDLDEQKLISINDVLSAYPQNLLAVSARYNVVSILAGRLARSGGCWKSDWAFYFNQSVEQWSNPCSTLNDVVLTGLQGVYNRLSNYYAAAPQVIDPNAVTLKVSGVAGESDKLRLQHYLQSLRTVKSVDWLGMQAGLNQFKVRFDGARAALEETLGLGRVLSPEEGQNTGSEELNYRLLPQRLP